MSILFTAEGVAPHAPLCLVDLVGPVDWTRISGDETLALDGSQARQILRVAGNGSPWPEATTLRAAGRRIGARIRGDELEVRCAEHISASGVAALLEGIATTRDEPLGVRVSGSHASVARADAIGRAIAATQLLTMRPPSDLTPQQLVTLSRDLAGRYPLTAEVLERDALVDGGYGGLVAVGGGSVHDPALVTLRYRPAGGAAPVALIGKGVTFDSGGLQLKTSSLEWMKMDMSGAAVVLSVLEAVAELGLTVNVDAILALAENMPGPNAVRPGDVIRQLDGTTTEVTSTDAEGRLILADAITHARRGGARQIVDVATLTDPFGLGDQIVGLCANDDALAGALLGAAEAAGEPMWRLPLWSGYAEWLATPLADRRNWSWEHAVDGIPLAGTIFAGLFLAQFAGQTPWAHVDIASTAVHRSASGPYPAGASGVAVATLATWIEGLA
jgi:leucyl aminopeptidase